MDTATETTHPEAPAADAGFRSEVSILRELLADTLKRYEETGDHDHSLSGNRPIPPGRECEGGDCNVSRVRKALALLYEV